MPIRRRRRRRLGCAAAATAYIRTCIYYAADDKRDCKAEPRVPIIQRETFAPAVLLGHVTRSVLSCLYARHNILFLTSARARARKTCDPYYSLFLSLSLFLLMLELFRERRRDLSKIYTVISKKKKTMPLGPNIGRVVDRLD